MSEDFGGPVRTACVNGAPVRVSTSGSGDPILLLMGIGASLDVWQPFAEKLLTRGYQVISLDLPLRHLSAAYATRVAGSLYGGRARLDPARYGVLIGSGRPPTWVGYLGQLYAVTGWSSIPWLHQLRSRTLVMNGEDDPIVRTLNGRIMAALIPDARLEIIRGGGHLFLLDQSKEAADLVHAFLDGGA